MQELTHKTKRAAKGGGVGGGVWFAGFLGALAYFLHFHSGTFWLVIVAIFKALFWPAVAVFYALHALGA